MLKKLYNYYDLTINNIYLTYKPNMVLDLTDITLGYSNYANVIM